MPVDEPEILDVEDEGYAPAPEAEIVSEPVQILRSSMGSRSSPGIACCRGADRGGEADAQTQTSTARQRR